MSSALLLASAALLLATMSADGPHGRFRVVDLSPAAMPGVPTDCRRLDYQSASDGALDWALVERPRDGERTWVVYLHGHGASGDQLYTRPDIRDLWLPEIRLRGFGILSPTLRGAAWMSPSAAADLRDLLAWVRKEHGARRFILLGGSMGGSSVLAYSVLRPSDAAAAIALCPASDIGAYAEWCSASDVPICREIGQAIELAYGGAPRDRLAVYALHSAVRQWRRLRMPVFVCHGARDAVIPVRWTRQLSAKLAGRAGFRYVEQPEGDHETPLRQMPEALAWVLDRLDRR